MTSRQRRWQIKKMEQGLCKICGKEKVNAEHCEFHRVKRNKISSKAQKKQRENETPEQREKRLKYHREYNRRCIKEALK